MSNNANILNTASTNKNAKQMCDCATYTEHDIPSMLTSSPDLNKISELRPGSSSKRRTTWHIFDKRKRKEYNFSKSKKESMQTGSMFKESDEPKLSQYRTTNTNSSESVDSNVKFHCTSLEDVVNVATEITGEIVDYKGLSSSSVQLNTHVEAASFSSPDVTTKDDIVDES